MTERVLIAGCGYVGTALGLELAEAGHEVFGLRRQPAALPREIRPLAADLARPETLRTLPDGIDRVFYTAAAGGGGEAAYRTAYVDGPRHLLEALAGRPVRRVLFTSSTGVYAQRGGEWVDEDSEAAPTHFSGRLLLAGEGIFAASGFPSIVLRLGGIYGPGRTRLIAEVRAGRATIRPGGPTFTNRIHRDDCAGALAHLAFLPTPQPLYVGVDREPAEEGAVLRWLASRLGAPPPVEAGPEAGSEPEPEARRGRSSKRCRSDRLVRSGYRFRHPTFREGYESVLRGMGLALACLLSLPAPARGAADAPAPPAFETVLRADHPLAGTILDVAAGERITPDELARRLAGASIVLLGERHDHPDHHVLQAWLVGRIAAYGSRPAVAFEMLDASQADALARHLEVSPRDAAGLGAAVGFDAGGWPAWKLYQPIAEAALSEGLPLRAANLGRAESKALGREGVSALPAERVARLGLDRPLPEAERRAIEREIVEGHCGHAPASALPGMVAVQRARDAHMAAVLQDLAGSSAAVLIAGNGHVRRDHGVPARLREMGAAVPVGVGILEVVEGQDDPRSYAVADAEAGGEVLFDYIWFTPRVDEIDPCVRFRTQLEGLRVPEGKPEHAP